MEDNELIPHLFRTEFRKIISVLCKRFGISHLEIAEDIVSDTFLLAAETWGLKGIPENPVAWLYTVSKNKTKNYLQRNKVFKEKIQPELFIENKTVPQEEDLDLSQKNIQDSQLQMMFVLCHPSISFESQIGLSLRVLCGFGISEIADAFLTSKQTINKRMVRAKARLKKEKIKMDFPKPKEIDARLDSVLKTLYLLFNEGYYSMSSNLVLKKDLCYEAMRLTYLLLENEITAKPKVNALLSLMCSHASRFDARTSDNGELILYEEQDPAMWNQELIMKAQLLLNDAAKGDEVSKYHLEAAIAFWHTQKEDDQKWENILQLYNQLLQIEYSPIAALNRTFALSKAKDVKSAILEAEKLKLDNYHLYHALLGNLYQKVDEYKSLNYYKKALKLAKTENDKSIILSRLQAIKDNMQKQTST